MPCASTGAEGAHRATGFASTVLELVRGNSPFKQSKQYSPHGQAFNHSTE
jgi:hypothetical protein